MYKKYIAARGIQGNITNQCPKAKTKQRENYKLQQQTTKITTTKGNTNWQRTQKHRQQHQK
ncbi:hypothetical protein TSUD_160680 [Trifolium subterraneum]|uniref:Uncharacterized protein n=1 Tax=Trifolium subterraneum TaxID=3900 RepID=A0A2Z6MJJ9_TRISU|nr:hypothetical protein TSUD_160680 [Trifolium subterraneum]